MKENRFFSGTAITFVTRILQMVLSLAVSIIIARVLGPDGKGIFALSLLFPTLILRFSDVGLEPATTYYVAQKKYSYPVVLGNNIIISFVLAGAGCIGGLGVVFFLSENFFSGVPREYLLISLILIPSTMLLSAVNQINMGSQQFFKYNLVLLFVEIAFVSLASFSLLFLGKGVLAAISSRILAVLAGAFLAIVIVYKFSGGARFGLNWNYVKRVFNYGVQAYIGNLIAFLNLRIDMLIINYFMVPKEVGFYSVSVNLTEKLWLISSVVSVVLFPIIASEKDEAKRKTFTPFVTRSVFFINGFGYLLMFILGGWIIELLYTKTFIPAVTPLKILILGSFPLSSAKVLSSDIAGRGKPILNTYLGAIVLIMNVVLNLLLIPPYGIRGAAWATTISYFIHFLLKVYVYCKISGNSWSSVLFPKKSDFLVYKERTIEAISRIRSFKNRGSNL